MDPLVAQTVFLDRMHIVSRPQGETRLSLDPTPERTPVRWWGGEGTLHFEGFTWSGAQMPDGMLMELDAVDDVPNFERSPVKFRLALSEGASESLRRGADLSSLHVELGWIFSMDYGASWERIDTYERGRLGEVQRQPGLLTGTIEGYEHDVDRGRPLTWSAKTHPDYAMAAELKDGGVAFNWPLYKPRTP